MNLSEALDFIYAPNGQRCQPGLGRMFLLMEYLGHPQRELKCIHVAGTNGKGSVCAMLSSILARAGYRTGLYTSPHLERENERFRINGREISDEALIRLAERVRSAVDCMEDPPTEFERLTAMAFLYFQQEQCDIVVLEVGLGGALDSTNVIPAPEAAVITNIGLEHTDRLGNTLEEIASAKGGIIKEGCGVIVYPNEPTVMEVLKTLTEQHRGRLYPAAPDQLIPLAETLDGWLFFWKPHRQKLFLPLLGHHQRYNAAVALKTVEILRRRGWSVSDEAVRSGLAETRWPGRLEVLGRQPLFLLDGGHNPQCAQALCHSLERLLPGRRVVFLTGVLEDKNYQQIFPYILPVARQFICVTPPHPRAMPAHCLAEYLSRQQVPAVPCKSVSEGIRLAVGEAGRHGVIVAFGSLYLAGAVRGAVRDTDCLSPGCVPDALHYFPDKAQ